jgi:RHS repeat-associated protein
MGREARLEYAPSTKFYLEDRARGEPWATRLHYPVQCLSRVETLDLATGWVHASRYGYHHGCHDGSEREFRGFGRVDRIDSEAGSDPVADQAPVLTKTWFHLGVAPDGRWLPDVFSKEYWSPKTAGSDAVSRLEPDLGRWSLSPQEWMEAHRAFKGLALREEVCGLEDGAWGTPYLATDRGYAIERHGESLTQKDRFHPATVWQATERESASRHHEKDEADPRIARSMVLDKDKYGRPTLSAEAVCGRQAGTDYAEQREAHIVIKETRYAADVETADVFRMGLECASKTWELTGLGVSPDAANAEELRQAFADAAEIPFEAEPSSGLQKRLVEHAETLFYDDALAGALPPGMMAAHGLPYESYSLAYTPGMLSRIYENRIGDPAMLAEGGFVQREDGNWWARSGMNIYDAGATSNFYLPCEVENAFGERTEIEYDEYNLLVASIKDPLRNTVTAVNDYRTLSPRMLTDPNGNRTAIETDALGIVVKTAAMGKDGGSDGDTLESPTARMEYGFAEFGEGGRLLKPSWIRTSSRETHGDQGSRWLETVEYSDGMGNIALVKTKAANQKWIGTGRTVLNNKGNPVKQYEPYFSGNDGWESEPEMREQGVTPILHYDPLSRLIRTDFPDGTHSKIEFTAWEQKDYDRCDTAAGSPHHDTPTVTHLDSLGRAFCVVANDGANDNIATRTVFDIEGNEKKIIDARGNAVMEYGYGIHGERCRSKSMDGGERWMLTAADGLPVCTWDSRGHRLRTEYDALRRPISQKLSAGGGAEKIVGKTVYGEEAPDSEQNNMRGQIWKVHDQSGLIENLRYDFKGNLMESKRRFTQEYKQTIDWSANPVLEKETFTAITAYDALNRATEIRTPHSDNIPASKIMPAYDDGGLLKTVNVSLRGAKESTGFVSDIKYNPKGQRERITYGNGATTKYEYDEKTFRLTKLLTTRNNGTDVLQDLNYTYDQMGNIIGITDNAQQTLFYNGQAASPSQTFEYDALYRLVKATGREHSSINADTEPEIEGYNPAGISPEDGTAMRRYTREWEYDNVGNILALIHQANGNSWNRSYRYDTNSNRLDSATVGQIAVNYKYNEHGSMTAMPHLQNMQWNFAEQLNHITRGTTEAYYNYDNSGQRTRKIVEKRNITEERLYLGGFEIFRKKVGGSLELERETLHIMDDVKRIAVVETLTVNNGTIINNPITVQRYQLSNNIESATLELDENANIISYEEYYPYGETSYRAGRNIAEVGLKRYRYTGKEKDEESGLYYYGARYYICWLGRWTATDPAGLVDGLNLYMYCRGSPVGLMDPEGTTGTLSYPNLQEFDPGNMVVQELRNLWNYTTNELGISQPQREIQLEGKYSNYPILGNIIDNVTISFIEINRQHIINVAEEHGIDPVAIAGAVAWELQNNIKGWASDFIQIPLASYGLLEESCGIGWGSMHLNVAKELEEQGLVNRPDRTEESFIEILPFTNLFTQGTATITTLLGRDVGGTFRRSMNLIDPSKSISYIGSLMARDARYYKNIAKEDISFYPEILTTLYNTGGAEERAKKLSEKRASGELVYPEPNDMGKWVGTHKSTIRLLLGIKEKP